MEKKIPRRQQILNALAKLLAESPGERITTAILAKSVGVSEAALYRHFPSKTKMFEGLIEFIEDSIFSEITVYLAEEKRATKRCEFIIELMLRFAENNPGISRILIGDALTGETERLRQRIVSFNERIQLQIAHLIQDALSRNDIQLNITAEAYANFLMVYVDGCITQFVRTEFNASPRKHWQAHWKLLIPH